jgi:hypothetical protein
MAFIINGNDNTIPMRVKSQCALLRANIDEFEKSKKVSGTTVTTLDRFPDQRISKWNRSSSITKRESQLRFYQRLVNELEQHPPCALSSGHSQAMQQD